MKAQVVEEGWSRYDFHVAMNSAHAATAGAAQIRAPALGMPFHVAGVAQFPFPVLCLALFRVRVPLPSLLEEIAADEGIDPMPVRYNLVLVPIGHVQSVGTAAAARAPEIVLVAEVVMLVLGK